MNAIARRLLVAAVRKLLPDNPGSALALRPPIGELITHSRPVDRRAYSQPPMIYAPPPAPVQPVVAPAPPPRRRRKVVVETITYEEREW